MDPINSFGHVSSVHSLALLEMFGQVELFALWVSVAAAFAFIIIIVRQGE
jgi:hypothetical protein